jgi:hypothetical protein
MLEVIDLRYFLDKKISLPLNFQSKDCVFVACMPACGSALMKSERPIRRVAFFKDLQLIPETS